MKELIQIENLQVEIWRRAYQRSLNLRVRPDGLVRVTCGRRVSRREVERFVADSREFILKRQLELEVLRKQFPEKKYLSGESFLYLGEATTLEVIWTWDTRVRVILRDGHLEMTAPLSSRPEERRRGLHEFFKKQARPHLLERVQQLSNSSMLFPTKVSVRGQRSRWGSCSARGTISLNWKLLAAPSWVINYVVIHELAHLRHLNHSRNFWNLVELHDPNWRLANQWLRQNEPALANQFA